MQAEGKFAIWFGELDFAGVLQVRGFISAEN